MRSAQVLGVASAAALLAAVVAATTLEAVVVLLGLVDPLVLPLPAAARSRAAGAEENFADRVALALRLTTLGHEIPLPRLM